MPTYAYACTACEHRFEIFQSFTEDSLTTCPECQGRLRKLFNPVGVVFKGSGFYRTDSRNESRHANGRRSRSDSGSARVPATSSESTHSASDSSSGSSSADSASGSSSAGADAGSSSTPSAESAGTTKTATKSATSKGSAA